MDENKSAFIRNGMFNLLEGLAPESDASWGKMNAIQMIGHLADFFRVSSGKIRFDLVSPEEHLPKLKAFLQSDKPFRENTKAPVNIVAEEPPAARFDRIADALQDLRAAVEDFYLHFTEDREKTTTHPVFGPLNFDDWILLQHKHVSHHLRQFGLVA